MWEDASRIDKWFCVDDNSSEEDRKRMTETFLISFSYENSKRKRSQRKHEYYLEYY